MVTNLSVLLSVHEDVHIFGQVFTVTLEHLDGFDGLDRLLVEHYIFKLIEFHKLVPDLLVVTVSIEPATEKLLSDSVLAEDDLLRLLDVLGLVLHHHLQLCIGPLLLDLGESHLVGLLTV